MAQLTYFADKALIDLGLCFVFRIVPHKRPIILRFATSKLLEAGRLIETNSRTIEQPSAPCLLRPPTFAGWISGIRIGVRIYFQSRDFHRESPMRLSPCGQGHGESRSILLELQAFASE